MTQKIIFLIFGAVIGVTTYAAVSYWGRSDDRSDARPTAASPTAPELPAETSKTGDAQKPAGQLVADDEGFFTFMVPADWIAKPVKGRDGLSEVVARSPDFKLRLDTAAEAPFVPHYYETGAELSVQVVPGEAAAAAEPIGTEFAVKKETTIAGLPAKYYMFKEPSTMAGQLIEARFASDGNTYRVRLGYNPATYPAGESVFGQVLKSFRLKNAAEYEAAF